MIGVMMRRKEKKRKEGKEEVKVEVESGSTYRRNGKGQEITRQGESERESKE